MKEYKNKTYPYERALYGEKDIILSNCKFQGKEDGESALKETSNVEVRNCFFDLRYPFWHSNTVKMIDSEMTELCRASFWYSSDILIENSKLHGIKALRECKNIAIKNSDIISPEFGWKSNNLLIDNTTITSEYGFFNASNLKLNNVKFHGKYSFQYIDNLEINDSILDTKDAFWHSNNVVVRNSIIKGEYLAWYSSNLTLINCKIIGTQPFCYCTNLKMINCTMENTDLCFEYSSVDVKIIGNIISIKNPLSGKIEADSINEILLTDDSKHKCECIIKVSN